MTEYIGDLKQYLAVQYAKSNRSKCRKCKSQIDKSSLRIGLIFDDDKFSTSNWFHPQCFEFKPRHKVIDSKKLENHIDGLNQLSKKDHKALVNKLRKDLKEFQQKEEKYENKRKKTYEAEKKHIGELKEYQKTLPKNQEAEQRKKQGLKRVKLTKKKPTPHKYLTPSAFVQYNRLIEHYKTYSLNQLKHLLEINGQAKIGRKDELAAKCADGKQLGQIPPCPKCGGGKLKFDRQTGLYHCPGYMEDTDFVHCDGKFDFGDVKRTAWIERND